jgi:hypothetical protein
MKQLDLLAAVSNEPEKLQLTASLEWGAIEAAEGGEKIPTFRMTAYTGGAMEVSGFFRPVIVDLGGVKVANKQIPIFREHDREKVVGHGEAIISATDITASGIISADNEHSRDVVTSAKRGFPWQASIGASVEEFESVKEGEKIKVNGKTVAGPVLVARKSTVYEISVVALGADRKTKTTIAASGKTKKGFQRRERRGI